MKVKKRIIIGLLICLLLIITALASLSGIGILSRRPNINLSKLIENENIDDLTLTIYYLNPGILPHSPVNVEMLVYGTWEGAKTVIHVDDLREHIDLFKQIDHNDLTPVRWWRRTPYMDIRLYYVLESRKSGKLFNVAAWGYDESIYVNGFEVKGKDIFYDVIMPFLPEDVIRNWEAWGFIHNSHL